MAWPFSSSRQRSTSKATPAAAAGWNPLTLAGLASLWIATLANWPLWKALSALPETASLHGALLALLALCIALLALVVASFADLSSSMRNHRSMRYLINPLNAFYGLAAAAAQSNARPAGPLAQIGLDVKPARHAGRKPPLLLLVIGETARADHFSLNGYARPTNPELSRLGVASFRQVMSCGTSTATSLPCMFSHLGKRAHEGRDRDHENLLDLLQRAGLAVL